MRQRLFIAILEASLLLLLLPDSSRQGQTAFSRATGYVSNRSDTPIDHVAPWKVPLPGSIKTYTQEAMKVKGPLLSVLYEVFGR